MNPGHDGFEQENAAQHDEQQADQHGALRRATQALACTAETLADLAKVSATAFERLLANPGVTAVDVTAQAPMVSTGGSEKEEAGARIYWDRAKADSIDFKQYRENVAESYFWDAYVGAPDVYIHPGVIAVLSVKDQAKLQR